MFSDIYISGHAWSWSNCIVQLYTMALQEIYHLQSRILFSSMCMHTTLTGIIHTSCIANSVVLDSSLPVTQESKQQATDINV